MSHVEAAEVEIVRDGWGIPHIRGGSAVDVAYGQGFATAEDRAWQLSFDGWRVEGRVAEHVGVTGLDWDVFARRAVIAETARACFDRLRPETRAFVTAYVNGVNDGLRTHTEGSVPELAALELPPPRWPDWMPLGIFVVQHILFSTFPTKLWRARLVDRLGFDALELLRLDGQGPACPIVGETDLEPVAIDRGAVEAAWSELRRELGPHWLRSERGVGLGGLGGGPLLSGSNSFAVGGARTASGLPLLGGDPHRLHDLPNVYHQIHLSCPEFDVLGIGFVGVPGLPHFAHAGEVAWGITNAMADYQDLYVEQLDRGGDQVDSRTADGWAPVRVRTETIEVRGAEPLLVETLRTRNGPAVLPLSDDLVLSLRTPALAGDDLGFDALLPLLRSRSAADVVAAVGDWVEPVNNLIAADRTGAVVYRTSGKVPVRSAANQWLPVPGWSDAYAWQGLLSETDLPYRTVAPKEQVVTANQRISAASCAVGVEPANSVRARRINDLLGGRDGLSVEDFAAVHADVDIATAAPLQKALGGLSDLDPAEQRVVDTIRAWDTAMAADSVAAGTYAAVRAALVDRLVDQPIFADLIENPDVPGFWDRWMSVAVRVHSGLETLLDRAGTRPLGIDVLEALRAAVGDVATDPAALTTWGSRHRYAPLHPLLALGVLRDHRDLARRLDVGDISLAGDSECVQANHSIPGASDLSTMGPVARYIWDLADRERSRWVVPLGASGHPDDPHFADQLATWAGGGSLPVVGDWARLENFRQPGRSRSGEDHHS